MRHYAKVAGSIPDEVVESTEPLTEMNTRNLPGCKGRLACKADNLTAIGFTFFLTRCIQVVRSSPFVVAVATNKLYIFWSSCDESSACNRIEYRKISGGKARPACNADNVTAICEHCLDNVESSTSHNPISLHCLLQGYVMVPDCIMVEQ
jgi:hypothetical protein